MKKKFRNEWSRKEINFLKNNYWEHGAKWCSEQLERPLYGVKKKALFFHLKAKIKDPTNYPDEFKILINGHLHYEYDYTKSIYDNTLFYLIPLCKSKYKLDDVSISFYRKRNLIKTLSIHEIQKTYSRPVL